jgi:hypothetical protein
MSAFLRTTMVLAVVASGVAACSNQEDNSTSPAYSAPGSVAPSGAATADDQDQLPGEETRRPGRGGR